jgi:predicted cupin superfamily sugar epimerase
MHINKHELIQHVQLREPIEGGYYGETYQSSLNVTRDNPTSLRPFYLLL